MCIRRVKMAVVLPVFVIVAACGDDLTAPSPERYADPRIQLLCNPSGVQISCTAFLRDVPKFGDSQEITSIGGWSVIPLDLGSFSSPGMFTPVAAGEARIQVKYRDWEVGFPPRFLVSPERDARWMHFFSAAVREGGVNGVGVGGARVEILDG